MAKHRIELAEPGTLIGARVVCDGEAGDVCQQWCAEGCEEQCYETPILGPDWPELCAMAPYEGHRWEPIGSCRVTDWLNAGDLGEACLDEDVLQFDDAGEAQPALRSGVLSVSWDGDSYLWEYEFPAGQQAVAV